MHGEAQVCLPAVPNEGDGQVSETGRREEETRTAVRYKSNVFIHQYIKLIQRWKSCYLSRVFIACKRKLSKTSCLLRLAATGNCPDRLGWVTARLTTAITCDTDR